MDEKQNREAKSQVGWNRMDMRGSSVMLGIEDITVSVQLGINRIVGPKKWDGRAEGCTQQLKEQRRVPEFVL